MGQITRWLVVLSAIGQAAPLSAQGPNPFARQDLQFGEVLPGVRTTVSRLDAFNSGQFQIQGAKRAEVRIEFVLPAALISQRGARLPLEFGPADGGFSKNPSLRLSQPFDPRLPLFAPLHSSGRLYLWLGGTAHPKPTQSAGEYEATVTLTVSYTGV
jgi:hypothetical protein